MATLRIASLAVTIGLFTRSALASELGAPEDILQGSSGSILTIGPGPAIGMMVVMLVAASILAVLVAVSFIGRHRPRPRSRAAA